MPTTTSEYRIGRSDACIRTAPDAVVVIDADGTVVEWNPAAERMFGWRSDEVIGRRMADVLVPERLRDAHHAGIDRYLRTRQGRILERRVAMPALRRDGGEFTVELTITAFDAAGRTWFAGWVRDMTEMREERAARLALETASVRLTVQNRSLRELDTLKTELVAKVSHELRTPLTAIAGFTELLTDDVEPLTDTQRSFVRTIADNSQRLTQLIEDLLVLNHLDTDSIDLQPTVHDPVPFVRTVVDTLQARARARSLELRLVTSPGPACCLFDAPRLQQLVTNLVGNAIKFTPVGGDPVQVTLRREHRGWVLEVADGGIGIPADEVDLLGTRFYRASNAREGYGAGTGLGLAVVTAIVAEHGGTLEIASVEGAGTTMTARFPCPHDEADAA